VRHDSGGRIHYRLRFTDNEELNSDDFRSIKPYFVGDDLNFREGLPNENASWQVSEVIGGGDEPDTLICDLVVKE
jgi:hypothetical protein